MRRLVVAVHDGTDRLACVHITESDDEHDEVTSTAIALGPVWIFTLNNEPLQAWFNEAGRRL